MNENQEIEKIRIFSLLQLILGGILFGPLAYFYFLYENIKKFGLKKLSLIALICSPITFLLVYSLFFYFLSKEVNYIYFLVVYLITIILFSFGYKNKYNSFLQNENFITENWFRFIFIGLFSLLLSWGLIMFHLIVFMLIYGTGC